MLPGQGVARPGARSRRPIGRHRVRPVDRAGPAPRPGASAPLDRPPRPNPTGPPNGPPLRPGACTLPGRGSLSPERVQSMRASAANLTIPGRDAFQQQRRSSISAARKRTPRLPVGLLFSTAGPPQRTVCRVRPCGLPPGTSHPAERCRSVRRAGAVPLRLPTAPAAGRNTRRREVVRHVQTCCGRRCPGVGPHRAPFVAWC